MNEQQSSKERFPFYGHDDGLVIEGPDTGFKQTPMTPAQLAAREPALAIAQDIYRFANYAGVCYVELWGIIAKAIQGALDARAADEPAARKPIEDDGHDYRSGVFTNAGYTGTACGYIVRDGTWWVATFRNEQEADSYVKWRNETRPIVLGPAEPPSALLLVPCPRCGGTGKLKPYKLTGDTDWRVDDCPVKHVRATLPPSLTHEAVYRFCDYLKEGNCKRCAAHIQTAYGPGQPGCFAVAHEHIEKALEALRQPSTKETGYTWTPDAQGAVNGPPRERDCAADEKSAQPTEVLHAPKSWADVASNNAQRAHEPTPAIADEIKQIVETIAAEPSDPLEAVLDRADDKDYSDASLGKMLRAYKNEIRATTLRNAERWRALIGCARIRVMGSAGLHDPQSNYAHIGVEFWTHHKAQSHPRDIETILKFVERAGVTKNVLHCPHDKDPDDCMHCADRQPDETSAAPGDDLPQRLRAMRDVPADKLHRPFDAAAKNRGGK